MDAGVLVHTGWSESDFREIQANHRDEVSSRWMYSRLAEIDPKPERAEMFRALARYEERHAALWSGLLRHAGRPIEPPTLLPNHRILVAMARVLGVGIVIPILHREEVDGVAKYRDQARRWTSPEARVVFQELLPDEVAHEIGRASCRERVSYHV